MSLSNHGIIQQRLAGGKIASGKASSLRPVYSVFAVGTVGVVSAD